MGSRRDEEELIRCGRDPIYFINNYVKIRHPTRGLILFRLFDFQRELLESFVGSRHNVVNKGRQMGISELTAAFILWMIMFYPSQSVLVMATKAETAKNMIKKVRTGFQNLPKWLQFSDLAEDNKLSLAFDNGSWVRATTKSADAGRSEALSLLVIDEAAHIKGFDEIWVSVKPTVTTGGRVTMISTPNGVGNVFHRTYAEAEAGTTTDWKSHSFPWWLHPEHIADLADDPECPGLKTSSWYRQETADLSDREKSQEYECSFLASGDTFVAGEILLKMDGTSSVPISVEEDDKGLLIFCHPVPGGQYLLSADVARGDSRDKCGCHLFAVETMAQDAEYNGRVPPDRYADLLCRLGWRYNKALLVVENNAVGLAVLEHVKLWEAPDGSIGYPNVYFTDRTPDSRGQALSATMGNGNMKLVIGFTTSTKSRELAVNKMEELLRTQRMLIRSKRLIAELKTFVWNGAKPEARSGAFDDLVMAAALAAWIRDMFMHVAYHTAAYHEKVLGAFSLETKLNTSIDGASKDPNLKPGRSIGVFSRQNPADMYRMRIRAAAGKETDIDLRQLFDRPPGIYKG